MRKAVFLFVLTLLLAVSQGSLAYNNGDTFTIGGITYSVTAIANYEVRVVGISDEALDENGGVTIPTSVFDGIDMTFAVKSVGRWTNTWSRNITTLTFSEGIESISADAAFCNARGLKTINLPASLKDISANAPFALLGALEEINVDENNNYFCSVDGVLYNKTKTELIRYPTQKAISEDGVYNIPGGVIKVWAGAFSDNMGLKTVNVPASVTELNTTTYGPFSGCRNLTDIVVDGGNAIYGDINGVLCDKAGETLIIYPEGKMEAEYTVPDGIKKIGTNCFYASRMQTVDLNNVEEIAVNGFNGCDALTEIAISSSITGIVEGSFYCCANIQNYKVDDANSVIADIDGVLCDKTCTKLLQFPLGRTGEYTVPESITEIASQAFSSAKLEKIIISENVKTIGSFAFRRAIGLRNIEFKEPSSVSSFGTSCFWACTSLEEVTLPTSIEEIGGSAFLDCYALKTVTVSNGSKLKTIGNRSFATCTALENFIFPEDCQVVNIYGYAFSDDTGLKSFAFPASINYIAGSAFSGCENMSTITFPTNAAITTIGKNAFDGCGLESVEIPSSVKTISAEAFKNCNKLSQVVIPANTTTISPEAFKYCKSLTDIEVADGNTKYSSNDGMLLSKDKETLMIFPAGKANDKFTLLPPSITKIGDYAFYDCSNLTNVTIPNKVTAIGQRAFGLCSNLNTIAFLCDDMIAPENIDQGLNTKSFDDNMFGNINISVRKEKKAGYESNEFYAKFKSIQTSFSDGDEEYIAVSANAVDLLSTKNTDHTYTLPSDVTYEGHNYSVALIGDYAFQNVSEKMKEVVVPKSVAYIGAKAFRTDVVNDKSTIERIFFLDTNPGTGTLSTLRFKLDDTGNDYGEFADGQNIYVKKSAVETYRSAWQKHKDAIDYKVPGINISTKYGTFAREFDTYLGDYKADGGKGSGVLAFIGGEYHKGTGDYGPETKYSVHMKSINAAGYDGLYIPKNTGVLLKVMNAEKTPADYYYCIGEKDDAEYNVTGNSMKGVTVNDAEISGYDKWVIQQGQFRALNGKTAQMPVHKAYLQLEGVPASAKIVFSFDDGSTTGVSGIDATNDEDAVYYNLEGLRVSEPTKGVYIYKGKKIVIK